ncbi:PH domain-containing protein [Cellulomonas endophytica]|uniref:PH domain-containing protein n=1 Tax=Cellulomonas endophytica TaxID=2494735 RepID=UPI001F0BC080|nr:PH domain-containing protein [Cellulomonas endophytica]
MGAGLAVLVAACTAAAVVVLPAEGVLGAEPLDRAALALLGAVLTLFCVRQAMVAAFVESDGLRVRNLVLTRRVRWAEVVSVRFGRDRPWVQLDLADGGTLAVMGVQQADGAHAEREARRLATLVAVRSRPPR